MTSGDAPAPGAPTRAQRDEARRQRAEAAKAGAPARRPGSRRLDDRPPPPWGSFPLSELAVFLSIVFIIGSFFVRGTSGGVMFVAGLLLGSLAGLEVAIREHFAGFRSHSTLLAGALGILTITVVALAAGTVFLPILLAAGLTVFGIAFLSLREAFRRRTGGVSFR